MNAIICFGGFCIILNRNRCAISIIICSLSCKCLYSASEISIQSVFSDNGALAQGKIHTATHIHLIFVAIFIAMETYIDIHVVEMETCLSFKFTVHVLLVPYFRIPE